MAEKWDCGDYGGNYESLIVKKNYFSLKNVLFFCSILLNIIMLYNYI